LLKTLILNTVSQYFLKILLLVLSFYTVPLFIKFAGYQNYGIYLLVQSIAGSLAVLNLGFPKGSAKFIAQFNALEDYDKLNRIINNNFVYYFIIGLVISILLWSTSIFQLDHWFDIKAQQRSTFYSLFTFAGVWTLIYWPATVSSNVLIGLQKILLDNTISALSQLLGFIGAIILLKMGKGVVEVFIVQNSFILIGLIIKFIIIKNTLPSYKFSPRLDKDIFKLIFAYSGWVALTSIAGILLFNLDNIIIGAVLSVQLISVYKILNTPFRGIGTLIGTFNSAIMPYISHKNAVQNESVINDFIYNGSKLFNSINALISISAFFFVKPFLYLWVGDEYNEYYWIAQLLCLFQIVWKSNSFLMQIFHGIGKIKIISIITIVFAILNVPIGYFGANYFGLEGTVYATIIVALAILPFQYMYAFPVINVDKLKYLKGSILKAFLPFVGYALALYLLRDYLYAIDSWLSLFGHSTIIGSIGMLIVAISNRRLTIRIIKKIKKT